MTCAQPWTATLRPRARSAAGRTAPEPPVRRRPPLSTTAPRPSAPGPRPTRSRSRRVAAFRGASSISSAPPATDPQDGRQDRAELLGPVAPFHPPHEPLTRGAVGFAQTRAERCPRSARYGTHRGFLTSGLAALR